MEAAYGDLNCPLDLHALVPVPDRVLRFGPDDPAAIGRLWEHWDTTRPLRGVEEVTNKEALPLPAGEDGVAHRFWSADWTPERAIAVLRGRWPSLLFCVSLGSVDE